MSPRQSKPFLEVVRERYKGAERGEKRRILDKCCKELGFHRKHLIRLLAGRRSQRCGRRGRPPRYVAAGMLQALEWFYMQTDMLCSKRLKAAIPLWLPFYETRVGRLRATERRMLLQMSPSTIDRLLRPVRHAGMLKGLSGTKPGSMPRTRIPIRNWKWNEAKVGFMEADTVAHCGGSLEGQFIWSVTMTDIKTGWTECRCVWNKGGEAVRDAIRDIEEHLPFTLKGFHCDNGSEFLTYHLVRYFAPRKGRNVAFTRSRPSYRNDAPHVEQKNWAHPRQLLGYDRLGNPALVKPICQLYANEWSLLHNHFMPSAKLCTKTQVGSRYHKTYDTPQTPYQRLMHCSEVAPKARGTLKALHATLDPIHLSNTVRRKAKMILNTPNGNIIYESTIQPFGNTGL